MEEEEERQGSLGENRRLWLGMLLGIDPQLFVVVCCFWLLGKNKESREADLLQYVSRIGRVEGLERG